MCFQNSDNSYCLTGFQRYPGIFHLSVKRIENTLQAEKNIQQLENIIPWSGAFRNLQILRSSQKLPFGKLYFFQLTVLLLYLQNSDFIAFINMFPCSYSSYKDGSWDIKMFKWNIGKHNCYFSGCTKIWVQFFVQKCCVNSSFLINLHSLGSQKQFKFHMKITPKITHCLSTMTQHLNLLYLYGGGYIMHYIYRKYTKCIYGNALKIYVNRVINCIQFPCTYYNVIYIIICYITYICI